MKNVTHWGHIDAAGGATVVAVLAGCKYWVVFRRKDGSDSSYGDMNSIEMFGGGWQPHAPFVSPDDWFAEGVLLTAEVRW